MVVMTRVEDGKVLKIKGTSTCSKYFAYMAQHNEGTLSSRLLWHARFGNINYDSLGLLKQKGVYGLPVITRRRLIMRCGMAIFPLFNISGSLVPPVMF